MTVQIHNVEQGGDEWHSLRTGLVTASEVGLILTPTLKVADNEKTRAHVYEIAAQRINSYTEPTYIGENMIRGHADEIIARALYCEHYEPVEEVGFITRDIGDIRIGYSPDGVAVLSNGGIECKSRRQKFQVEVVTENEVPKEHILQCQSALFVTGWDWIDYVSYSGGMPLWVIRVTPERSYQDAILAAVVSFEAKVKDVIQRYNDRLQSAKVIPTERATYDLEAPIT